MNRRDRELGMGRPIPRRDFLQGATMGAAAIAAAGFGIAGNAAAAPGDEDYPPARTGMRGSHPGSFEAAHALRDGIPPNLADATDPGDGVYDLIVVGGGISGLSAAYFYRSAHPDAKILIIENHDDFGGHAKRNEVTIEGRQLILNGGTQLIESPTPYGAVSARLMAELGVDPEQLSKECDDPAIYDSLGLQDGSFFDRETFGADRLVAEDRHSEAGFAAFLEKAPLSPAARQSLHRIEKEKVDYLRGRSDSAKKDLLSRMSYLEYLTRFAGADPAVIAYYRRKTDSLWGCGIDAVSAIDCWGVDLPGFQGLGLRRTPTKRMGYTPAGFVATGGSPVFHFPDGNASIARLLVRGLVPGAIPGKNARDVVTAKVDYGALDRPGARVRLRLGSMALHVRNAAVGGRPGVEVFYGPSKGDARLARVTGLNCVLACWNMMIPAIFPEIPETQKAALHKLVKTPLVYTSVGLRNWEAFARLKIKSVYAPGGYYSRFELNEPVNIGDYRSPRLPAEPNLIRMLRTPAKPGLSERAQHSAGRAELLGTSFETFERETRQQLARILGPGGFDPARDITAIIVNRWPHGYAPEYNALIDGDTTSDRTPNLIGRARRGRVAIANSDAGMAAYTDSAIDQAYRAVSELARG
ncbi:MAG: NAD(P)-binding protein [Sphingomonas sp.]